MIPSMTPSATVRIYAINRLRFVTRKTIPSRFHSASSRSVTTQSRRRRGHTSSGRLRVTNRNWPLYQRATPHPLHRRRRHYPRTLRRALGGSRIPLHRRRPRRPSPTSSSPTCNSKTPTASNWSQSSTPSFRALQSFCSPASYVITKRWTKNCPRKFPPPSTSPSPWTI